MRIFIDHVRGQQRGQRQQLDDPERVRFGRHPDCEVAFDAERELDASSRHAELRRTEAGYVIVDVGSSNGTFVNGERVSQVPLVVGRAFRIEFGRGGPRVCVTALADDAGSPPLPVELAGPGRGRVLLWLALAALVIAVVVIVGLRW